jgi:hypothetical protein
MNAPWNIVGLFCEDIREEKSGQHTLIGIMPDNMAVPHMPGAIPKLGIYARCHVDPNVDVGSISLKLKFPDGEEAPLSNFDEAAVKKVQTDTRVKGTPLSGFLLIGLLGMLKLPAPGRVLAIVTIGGQEVVAAAINFELTPEATADATASQPPV